MVTVNIQEMLSKDSDDQEQATVSIKPRHPVSQEKLVSVVLDVGLKKPTPDASPVSLFCLTMFMAAKRLAVCS